MAIYPERPKRVSGYTNAWISSYLHDKATATQIRKYLKAIEGKGDKERKQLFYDMFIEEKSDSKVFEDELKKLLKQKRAEEKTANKEKEQAAESE